MTKGWPTKKLGEICQTSSGGTPLKSKKAYYEGGTIPWLMSGEVSQGEVHQATNFITQMGLECSSAKIFPPDTVLVAMYGATAGQVGILRFSAATNQAICGVLPTDQYVPEFLFYFLLSRKDELIAQATGNAQPNISQIKIRNTEVPIVPHKEQQRIVTTLNQAFDGIATAKANAEKNLQNARALFDSHLLAVFTRRKKGWVETKLGDEIDLLAGFAFKSAQYTESDDAIRLLRGDNIVPGSLRWDDVKKWPRNDTSEYGRYELQRGDIVLAMDRPWVKAGLKHAMISNADLPSLLVQRTARLRVGSTMDNRFLMHLIGSADFTQHILGVQTGIGVPHISGQQIKDFRFFRPPIEEQKIIAQKLDSLLGETQRLESLYQRKLAALDELKKSLLHQAFSGQL
jgi:type I restriction enzyme S subunit